MTKKKENKWQDFLRTMFAVVVGIPCVLLMASLDDSDPSGTAIIAICALVIAGTIGWGLLGAPLPPEGIRLAMAAPGFGLGFGATLSAWMSTPTFWPFVIGCGLTIGFTLVASALCWRRVPRGYVRQEPGRGRFWQPGNRILLIMMMAITGFTAFQGLVLRVNGLSDAVPARVLPGTIANRYSVSGKSTTYYLDLQGPAAAYGTSFTAGEYAVNGSYYGNVGVGDTVCVTLHTGQLWLLWWHMGPCPA